ncbi:MAG: ATP-binding cassette domain-containing protein, partial [Bacteroidales bacterium]
MAQHPLLSIENLSVDFTTEEGVVRAVENISFELQGAQTLGIVGESGSGKSVTALAIMGLLSRQHARVSSGCIWFDHPQWGRINLLEQPPGKLQSIRGQFISMVFQEPMTALNPVQRCGRQVMESLLWHQKANASQARRRVLELFEEVRLPDPQKAFEAYPHELSGGQRQRVMIAMAMACKPLLLIADEPTTALDVTVQKNILELMAQLQKKHQMAIIFISHDLGVVGQVASQVAVMLKGRIVESGPVKELFHQPTHPYTKGLIACRPRLDIRPLVLPVISDFIQKDGKKPGSASPEMKEADVALAERQKNHQRIYSHPPILKVQGLTTSFATQRSWLGKVRSWVHAVDNVSFSVYKGETLGLVG